MSKPTRSPILSVSAAILALLGGMAAPSLVTAERSASAGQPATRNRNDEDEPVDDSLLLISPRDEAPMLLAHGSHRSHSSHSSHRSHSSHSSGGYGSGYSGPDPNPQPAYTAPPPPPKPAVVSIAAYPGGQITVDGKPAGRDVTTPMVLMPGSHEVRVVNRFLGDHTETVSISDGQTGEVEVEW